jgi:ubiquinone/menaquinone biosynthesis C-methylase UbiE
MERLKQWIDSLSQPKILDIGTGVGNFVHLITSITSNYGEIVGVDTSVGAIHAARKHFEGQDRIRFEVMDAINLPFPNETFDVVCLSNTLHHLSEPKAIFEAMERVVKPGGTILVNEMISDGLNEKQLSHRKLHHFAAEIDRHFGITHEETYPKAKVLAVLKRISNKSIQASWELQFGDNAEPSDEEVSGLIGTVDRLLVRLKDSPKEPEFKAKGERIKQYIKKHKFASATQVVTLLQ